MWTILIEISVSQSFRQNYTSNISPLTNDVHRWSFLSFSRLTNYFRFWSVLFLWGPAEMMREELCEWKSNRWAHKWDLTFLKRPLILISLQILLIPTKSQLKCVNYYKGGFGGVSLYMKGYESQVWGRDQREWVFEVREVKSENKKLSLFFEKCKVKKKCFHSFSRSAKWK